jgi:general stress protein YciG
METPREYYYTYYSYEEYGRGYFGSRGCKCLPEDDTNYFGSSRDKTFRPTQKIILKDDYATREEAYVDEIILQEYYKVVENPHFANRSYQTSTKFYVPKERAIEIGRKGGSKSKELGVGVHGLTKEQRIKNGKMIYELGLGIHSLTKEQRIKNGKMIYELGLGIHARTKEQMSEHGKKSGKIGGNKSKELGLGLFALTPEQQIENRIKGGIIAGNKTKELGIGIHAQTKEQLKDLGRKSCSQRWMCLETGFITNAGNLTKYQRAREIDPSMRIRLE